MDGRGVRADDASRRDLQSQVAEQEAWARASAAEVGERDHDIRGLETSLSEQTRWAQDSVAAVVQRNALIERQSAYIEELTRRQRERAAVPSPRVEDARALRAAGAVTSAD